MRDIAFHRFISIKHRGHDPLAPGIGHEFTPVSEQAAGRHQELQAYPVQAAHMLQGAAAPADLFDHRDRVIRTLVVTDHDLQIFIGLLAHGINGFRNVRPVVVSRDADAG